MHPEEAEEHLAVIRATMERTTRYAGLPALSCFVAGGLALFGYGASRFLRLDFDVPRPDYITDWRLAYLWAIVCVLAMGQFVVLTIVASRRRAEPVWSRLTARVTAAVLPGIFVAAVLTLHLAKHLQFDILPPLWCLCYGVSLLGLGLYAGWKANLTGCLFLAAGSIALLKFRAYGLELMAVAFGGFHVLLGILIRVGHDGNRARSED